MWIQPRDEEPYWAFFKAMAEVSPGKMLALGECDEIPNPDNLAAGRTPMWLYALPWWGTPSARRPVEQAIAFARHPLVVTLDELPAFGDEDPPPVVGLLSPRDDGSAWFVAGPVRIDGYAVDRRGKVVRVEFWADGERVGVLENPPRDFRWEWDDPPAGCYDLRAVAVDDSGQTVRSNRIHLNVRLVDAARGRPAGLWRRSSRAARSMGTSILPGTAATRGRSKPGSWSIWGQFAPFPG